MASWKSLIAAFALLAAGAATTAAAQEMSFRSGVVTAVAPIQVAAGHAGQASAAPSRTGGAMGRAMSRMASRAAARMGGEYGYEAASLASGVTQDTMDAAARAPQAGAATTTAYMVMIRFDDGQESAIQSVDASRLAPGNRVRVFGSGSAAQIVAQ